MARRAHDNAADLAPAEALVRPRVLILSPRQAVRAATAARLRPVCDVQEASSVCQAQAGPWDAAVVDADGRCAKAGLALLDELLRLHPALPALVLRADADREFVLDAVRRGARDVVAPTEDIAARVSAARKGSEAHRAAEARLERRLRRVRDAYREVSRSRQELIRQMGSLCADMSGSYRELASRMRDVALVSEVNAIFRQELDLESLLRTALELVLRRVGPLNAAIFLPGTTGDYSLGAYINYDCSKDAAETLLDHLADVAAPAFADREGVSVMRNFAEICQALGRETDWLGDSTMAALSCRKDGECLAVMVFFRDRRTPFDEKATGILRVLGDAFGAQLDRVIKTHHRHLPQPSPGPDEWDRLSDGDFSR
ncbi:MAG: GAF domain-containing protein [Leptolyngbya sp. PLA1]|nr:GAF domain-containing protein [Leptolyngbya sp. PLA1]